MMMNRMQRLLTAWVLMFGMLALGQSAIAQGKGHGGAGGDKGPAEKGQEAKGQEAKGPEAKGQEAKGPGEKARGKANHKNGKQMLGEKLKTNGRHMLEKKGNYTSEVDVQNGKIAGLHVKHASKGEVPVKKYKTKQKMAQKVGQIVYASLQAVQYDDEYVGTIYIGYAYIDEFGYEEIYWFPYDMIIDGDTGAVWYEPVF